MSKLKIARVAPPQAPAEPRLEYPSNFVGIDWVERENVKELAYGLRVNSELAMLAHKGLRAHEAEAGTPHEDVYKLVEALIDGVALGAFVLAKKLDALPGAVA